jgi:hypothetical protein
VISLWRVSLKTSFWEGATPIGSNGHSAKHSPLNGEFRYLGWVLDSAWFIVSESFAKPGTVLHGSDKFLVGFFGNARTKGNAMPKLSRGLEVNGLDCIHD